jgi:hypothetical protein
MGFHVMTVRGFVQHQGKLPNGLDGTDIEVFFSTEWWEEFCQKFGSLSPELGVYLNKLGLSWVECAVQSPVHPTYHDRRGHSVFVRLTAEECREVFRLLTELSEGGQLKVVDFWQFTAMVCHGIIEEGLTVI